MTKVNPATQSAPSPAEIDLKAIDYRAIEKTLEEARAAIPLASVPVAAMKGALIDLVREYGGPHAEKSKILHGIAWEMMATFGQGMTQDSAAIERLRTGLKKTRQTRLLKLLFQQDVRWTFNADAAEVVKRQKLTPTVMRLLLLCFVPSDRTPTLDVREKKKKRRPPAKFVA